MKNDVFCETRPNARGARVPPGGAGAPAHACCTNERDSIFFTVPSHEGIRPDGYKTLIRQFETTVLVPIRRTARAACLTASVPVLVPVLVPAWVPSSSPSLDP
jgi:hypothetical protein